MRTVDDIIASGDKGLIFSYAEHNTGWYAEKNGKCLTDDEIARLEDAMIATGDVYAIAGFANNIEGAHKAKLQEAVISMGKAKKIVDYATCFHGKEEISQLEDAIIDIGDAYEIIEFARRVEGADIGKLQEAVIRMGDYCEISRFAGLVKGADIERLQELIIESKDGYALIDFAELVDEADVKRLEDIIVSMDDAGYFIHRYATRVKRADIERLQELIIEKDYGYIKEFVLHVKGVNISKMQEDLIAKGNAGYITEFVRVAENVDIPRLQEALIQSCKTNNCGFDNIWLFAEYSKGKADIEKLQNVIIESGDLKAMSAFAKVIQGADKDKIREAMLKIQQKSEEEKLEI